MDKKKRNKIIIYSLLGIAAVALVFNKSKAGLQTKNDTSGGAANPSSETGGAIDFRSLANQLFDAFDGYGTDNDKVKRIFKLLKTDADFDNLKAAYGVREVSSGRGNIFVSNYEGDLSSTIRNEMSDSEVAELNQILTSNRISRAI